MLLSPDYVRLPISSDRTSLSKAPESASQLSTSRAKSILISRPNPDLAKMYASEDRVVQRYEEEQLNYQHLVDRIHRKSLERDKRKHKGGLSLIY